MLTLSLASQDVFIFCLSFSKHTYCISNEGSPENIQCSFRPCTCKSDLEYLPSLQTSLRSIKKRPAWLRRSPWRRWSWQALPLRWGCFHSKVFQCTSLQHVLYSLYPLRVKYPFLCFKAKISPWGFAFGNIGLINTVFHAV